MQSDKTARLSELIDRARTGDQRARDELFGRCRNYLQVVARAQVESWLETKVDPSDLVQQTLLEAHRGLADFNGDTEAEWLAWLRRILAHNATDFVRQFRAEKRQINRERRLADAGEDSAAPMVEPAADGETPSEYIMRQERDLELVEAMSQLSSDYQEVIMLRNLQRLPFDEVARRMGRSRPAVQMLWMRALKKLKEQLTGSHSSFHP